MTSAYLPTRNTTNLEIFNSSTVVAAASYLSEYSDNTETNSSAMAVLSLVGVIISALFASFLSVVI